jgi:hypothetical protein
MLDGFGGISRVIFVAKLGPISSFLDEFSEKFD